MKTECNAKQIEFHGLGNREIIGKNDGGLISSDGGGLLLREVEKRTGILKGLSECFTDYRNPSLIEHTVESLINQRVMGIALGYEDLNDHDQLRQDPVLAVCCDHQDPLGLTRIQEEDKGKALAGKSTLNRLELAVEETAGGDRYKKIVSDSASMDELMVDVFIKSYKRAPKSIILDADATDDVIHGTQEGRFFNGYYRNYCYLPLYIFCGEHLLCARLRTSDQDGAAGTKEELQRIVKQIKAAWPKVRILIRGDSGFCRDDLMSWCEQEPQVDYILGIARNSRLHAMIEDEMTQAKALHEQTGESARLFKDFHYKPLKNWETQRRVIGKAEYLSKGENPRFIVTSLKKKQGKASHLYEDVYCARGDMENRIKEQQLCLFADRTSTHEMHSNQLRLYFSSFAYLLVQAVRRLGLKGTAMAKAQCDTIRLKLFKIGAQIKVSVRRIYISFSESYPFYEIFQQALRNIQRIPLLC